MRRAGRMIMAWIYVQRTGSIYLPNGKKMGVGYSGNTVGLNNPGAQDKIGVGPVPRGVYTIGPAHTPVDHLGALAMPLIPNKANDMHGRSGFFIHGDNSHLNHTASNGCIILSRGFRQSIDDSTNDQLVVVAEENEVASHAPAATANPAVP